MYMKITIQYVTLTGDISFLLVVCWVIFLLDLERRSMLFFWNLLKGAEIVEKISISCSRLEKYILVSGRSFLISFGCGEGFYKGGAWDHSIQDAKIMLLGSFCFVQMMNPSGALFLRKYITSPPVFYLILYCIHIFHSINDSSSSFPHLNLAIIFNSSFFHFPSIVVTMGHYTLVHFIIPGSLISFICSWLWTSLLCLLWHIRRTLSTSIADLPLLPSSIRSFSLPSS